ncbi:hypothetical protein T09_4371 [Trichinella sp. T9]|nr:hypothetical protein T09_4371 [Trichinella sp. T9]
MGEQCFDIGLIVQMTNGHLTQRLLIPGDTNSSNKSLYSVHSVINLLKKTRFQIICKLVTWAKLLHMMRARKWQIPTLNTKIKINKLITQSLHQLMVFMMWIHRSIKQRHDSRNEKQLK